MAASIYLRNASQWPKYDGTVCVPAGLVERCGEAAVVAAVRALGADASAGGAHGGQDPPGWTRAVAALNFLGGGATPKAAVDLCVYNDKFYGKPLDSPKPPQREVALQSFLESRALLTDDIA